MVNAVGPRVGQAEWFAEPGSSQARNGDELRSCEYPSGPAAGWSGTATTGRI